MKMEMGMLELTFSMNPNQSMLSLSRSQIQKNSPSPKPKRNSQEIVDPSDIEPKFENSKEKDLQSDAESKKSKKGGKTTNVDSSFKDNRSMQSANSNNDNSEEDDEENEEGKDKNEGKTEEEIEKERQKLLDMEWNKKFNLRKSQKEPIDEAVQSEMKTNMIQRNREKKLGIKLWGLIGYCVFFVIFSILVFSHVNVAMFNMYNDSLQNNIEGITIQSNENEFINITELSSYREISRWLVDALPGVFDDEPKTADSTNYYFINDYNFVLERRIRICFRMAKEDIHKENNSPKDGNWDRKNGDSSIYKDTFVGKASGNTYTYISNGFHNKGSH
jgi:hypothetical protein